VASRWYNKREKWRWSINDGRVQRQNGNIIDLKTFHLENKYKILGTHRSVRRELMTGA
jgi:hypothetical protein